MDKHCRKIWEIPKARAVALTVVIPEVKTDGCRATAAMQWIGSSLPVLKMNNTSASTFLCQMISSSSAPH